MTLIKTILLIATVASLTAAAKMVRAQGVALPETRIRVDPARDRGAISPYLYGSNHRYSNNGTGTWDPEQKRTLPVFDRNHRETGLRSIRYPGGTVGNTFEWKKAIGAVEKRPLIQPFSGGGTPTGVFGKPQVATFGVDEAARWCEKNEVTMIYMYGIAFGTPDDAADLVEYLNAPLGSNPGGGTNWANVRAENGHPAPYNIKYFEIANEADGPSQRYWWPFIDSDQTRAKAKMPFQAERDSYTPEFCFGGITRFEKQLVGARDEQGGRDFRDEVARGSGKPGQSKVLRYVPTEPGSDQVFVGGEPWQRVDDLSAATGKVYRIEPKTGTILFGDGTKGDAPPQGAEIAASYRARRWGFVDYYAAMKKVDPTIRIYAGYESLNIVRTLGSKHPYDGVVVHPYTAQYKVPKADTLEDWHHNLMLSSDRLGHEVREYQELIDKTVTPERRGKVHVICTEFGALNQNQVMPAGNSEGYWRFLNIGLYTGAQLLEFMRIGVPQAHRHATTVGVLGPAPQFEMSPTALAYQVFTHHFGDRLIGIKLENNPVRPTRTAHQEGVGVNDKLIRMDSPKLPPGAQPLGLPRLNAEASRDAAGNVYVLVINQDATEDVSARIDIAGAAAKGDAEIWTLNGPSFQAVNTPQNPEAVRIRTESRAVTGPFRHTFPAHSLTAIRFSREKKP